MKYVVEIAGKRVEVVVDGDQVTVDGGAAERAQLSEIEGTPVRLVTVGTAVHRVMARRDGQRGSYSLRIDGRRYAVEALDERTRAIRDLSAAAAGPVGPQPVKAPMPGLMVRIDVKIGDQVKAGQGVAAMEAMKMENELRAPGTGRVRAVHVKVGQAVEKGALLVEFESE
jgi:biotin carboxyl carrier protein